MPKHNRNKKIYTTYDKDVFFNIVSKDFVIYFKRDEQVPQTVKFDKSQEEDVTLVLKRFSYLSGTDMFRAIYIRSNK